MLGIIGLISSWVPIVNNFSFILAGIGLVFGVIGLVGTLRGKKSGKGLAIAAAVICVLSCAIVLATQSAYSQAIDDATEGVVSTSDGDASTAGAATESAAKYSIDGVEMSGDEYSCSITGTYTNNTGAEQSYVQLSYNLYDADGNQIGTAYANTSNLADGATWKFEAIGSESSSEVAKYELADVTGW